MRAGLGGLIALPGPVVALGALLLAGCATAPSAPVVPVVAPVADTASQTVAWTYGTAEAAMLMQQGFRALVAQVRAARPAAGSESAIAGPDGALLPCTAETAAKPAVIFDLDETLLWNVGHQQWQARNVLPFDKEAWAAWERDGGPGLLAAPGAVEAVAALRAIGVTPVFNSNRATAHEAQTIRDLARLGFGDAVHGTTLFLEGDAPDGSRKDRRRAGIAKAYCVLAQAGDQMGDFTDSIDFDADGRRRSAAARTAVAAGRFGKLWNQRWFLFPNPMYGRWNTPPLSLDEAVPPADRWTPRR